MKKIGTVIFLDPKFIEAIKKRLSTVVKNCLYPKMFYQKKKSLISACCYPKELGTFPFNDAKLSARIASCSHKYPSPKASRAFKTFLILKVYLLRDN